MKKNTTLISPLLFLLHAVVMFCGYFILRHFGIIDHDPSVDDIGCWDAGILASIKDNGYHYDTVQHIGNTGMFPLFPYVWRWTTLGAPGICVLNYLLMLGAFWWLAKTYKFPPLLQLWLLAVPSMLFFYLPYSEAFFFVAATFIVAGVDKNKPWMMFLGIYLCMLSRGTGLFFIPIVILMEWAEDFSFRKEVLIRVARKSILPILAVVAGIVTIAFIQYIQTGYAFSFFTMQTTGTGKEMHGLHFPITTWYPIENLWQDGLAALVGIIVSVILLFTIWGRAEESVEGKPILWDTKVVRFSMLFLAIHVWYVLFNAPLDPGSGCISVMALGRYVFCNPFWMIFALAVANRPKGQTATIVLSLIVIFFTLCLIGVRAFFNENAFWGQFQDPALAYRLCMLLLIFPLFFANIPRVSKYLLVAGYLVCVYMQLLLFNSFIMRNWVG